MKIFALLFILSFALSALAGLPPTTTKGSNDSAPIVTFRIDSPGIPITHTGTTATLGTVSLSGGGTNKNLTAVNGGIVYSDADSFEILGAGTSGYVLQSNGAAAPSWVQNGGSKFVSSDLTLTASDTIAISLVFYEQTWLVKGNSGSVSLSSTPFGSSAPLDGAEITLIGNTDSDAVTWVTNDAAKGIIGYGGTLGRGKTVTFIYNATLDRYVIKSFSN